MTKKDDLRGYLLAMAFQADDEVSLSSEDIHEVFVGDYPDFGDFESAFEGALIWLREERASDIWHEWRELRAWIGGYRQRRKGRYCAQRRSRPFRRAPHRAGSNDRRWTWRIRQHAEVVRLPTRRS